MLNMVRYYIVCGVQEPWRYHYHSMYWGILWKAVKSPVTSHWVRYVFDNVEDVWRLASIAEDEILYYCDSYDITEQEAHLFVATLRCV